ncbi:MAG: preprotein translocase subunit TatB [Deltaproteobacteria bacterium]|nr:preprotein translocase subunit TatB [Deltaproteobacteria bacterium]
MDKVIDARGLSCPQPVIVTLDTIKNLDKGEIEIIVDTETAKENVTRAIKNKAWQIKDIKEQGEGYRIMAFKD